MVEEICDLSFVAKVESLRDGEVLACCSGEGHSTWTGKDTDRAVAEAADVVEWGGKGIDIEIAVTVLSRQVTRGHQCSLDAARW